MAVKEIFLSYGREEQDIQRFVLKLKHDLEKNGFSVWLDMEDIPAGSDWHAAIGTGLHNCSALLALITNKYVSSRYCASELYTADSDKKHVFPLIVEEVDFESTERGRGVKYVVSGINWVYFRHGKDDYFSSLLKLMQGMREKGLGCKDGEDPSAVSPLVGQMGQLQLSPHPQPPDYPPAASPQYSPALYPPGSPQYPPGMPSQYPPGMLPSQYPPGTPSQYPPGMLPAHYPSQFSPHYPAVSSDGPVPYHGYHQQQQQGLIATAPPQYTDLYPDTPSSPPQQPPSPPPVASNDPEKGGTAGPPPPAPPVVSRNPLRIGLKLEADDRRFPYYVCVATIQDMRHNNIMIHFDGWGQGYDYWCSTDSVEIHPVGWCRKYSWELQPPKDRPWNSWNQYLHAHRAEGADDTYFNKDQLAPPGSLCFSRGMRLEAKDRKNPHLTCVATIADIQNGHLLIHFDGWSNTYDYWCLPNTTDIHPPMWASKHNKRLEQPKGHASFKWSTYLNQHDINPAPAHLFTQLQLGDGRVDSSRADEFEVSMKLEAKDRLYPTLVCVATINDIKNGKLLVHFDGWNNSYDYWCEPDSMDIHPIRWCHQRGRALQAPHGYGREFSWDTYLSEEGALSAPLSAFTAAQK